ncbi:DUF1292 domain-containing protein [Lachnospiraceae bacterium 29-84]
MSKKPITSPENEIPQEEDEDIFVTLTMEDDSEIECRILTIFTYGEQDYIALRPIDGNGEDLDGEEIYLFHYFEDSEGTPSLEDIEDEDEFEDVSDFFVGLIEEDTWNSMFEDPDEP